MKLGMYIMAPEAISEAYFINPSHHCVYPPYPCQATTRVNMFPRQQRTVGGVVFYAVRVVPKERRRLVFPKLLVKFLYANHPKVKISGL
jgi:hypothetical protein